MTDYSNLIVEKAIDWIKNNTINGQGIAVTSKQQVIYPEVTGYYIPTLIEWGEKELAISYAKFLCSIQKENGAWFDSQDIEPYVFDTAQALKGLIAVRELFPDVEKNIICGCDWLMSRINDEGRLTPPNEAVFSGDETFYSELIHLYCLTPLRDAGNIYDRQDYITAVDKVVNYYKKNYSTQINNFSLLSHFYAYVMEGLCDLGEVQLVRNAMNKLEKYQDRKGGIPGLNDVTWVCSTGLFQLALVWYKLGELDKGNRIYNYACSLQNESGGWYGSYPKSLLNNLYRGRKRAHYFPDEEISWANKYFLDALAYKMRLEFEKQAHIFSDTIQKNDGRYLLVKEVIQNYAKKQGSEVKICDVGCGKGRYLKNLVEDLPDNKYYASDISIDVMREIDFVTEKNVGRLTNIPYKNNQFDIVYVVEALEHSVYLTGAFKELHRIVKPGGKLIIIDKTVEKLGQLQLDEYEQWMDDQEIKRLTNLLGGKLEIISSVSYENVDDGLFRAWIIEK